MTAKEISEKLAIELKEMIGNNATKPLDSDMISRINDELVAYCTKLMPGENFTLVVSPSTRYPNSVEIDLTLEYVPE